MGKKERIARLEEYMDQAFEKINTIEIGSAALTKRLEATRDHLLKMQAEAAGAKPLDLRESKFFPEGAEKLPPDIEHFNGKAKQQVRQDGSITPAPLWPLCGPTITHHHRSNFGHDDCN